MALIDGLRGKADTFNDTYERDRIISINELELYIKKRIISEKEKVGWNKSITPQLRELSANEGEFFFFVLNENEKNSQETNPSYGRFMLKVIIKLLLVR